MKQVAIPVLIYAVLLTGGCGNMNRFKNSPSDLVKKYFASCNSDEYSKAEETLATDAKKLIHGGLVSGGLRGMCEEASRDGTIDSVEIKSETIRGEGATVVVLIRRDRSSRADFLQTIKEDGSWKITPRGF